MEEGKESDPSLIHPQFVANMLDKKADDDGKQKAARRHVRVVRHRISVMNKHAEQTGMTHLKVAPI